MKFPISFFPRDENKYKEYKKILDKNDGPRNISFTQSYWDAVEEVDEICWIVNRDELLNYLNIIKKNFGGNELELRKEEIKSYLKKGNIKVRVIDRDIGYRYYLTENSFQLILMFEPVFIGMIISDFNVLEIYNKIFKNSFKHGVNLVKYLK